MKLYKLTNELGQTYNHTQWGVNTTHTANYHVSAIGMKLPPMLCSPYVIHAYTHPLVGVLMNPIHANFSNPQLWEAEGEVVCNDGCKIGCISLTTIKQIPLPQLTVQQKVIVIQKIAAITAADAANIANTAAAAYVANHAAAVAANIANTAAAAYVANHAAADAAADAADAAVIFNKKLVAILEEVSL